MAVPRAPKPKRSTAPALAPGEAKRKIATTPINATNCLSAGGHWDPTDKEHDPYVCTPEARDECYTGDLSGMLGPLAVSPDNSFSPLTNFPTMGHGDVGSAADLRSRSIVIHAANGRPARLACADIVKRSPSGYTNPCESSPLPPPPPPPPDKAAPCSDFGEMSNWLDPVNAACCGVSGEDCSSGVPSKGSCSEECADVLGPFMSAVRTRRIVCRLCNSGTDPVWC